MPRGPGLAETVGPPKVSNLSVLLETPSIVRRDARVVLEWGLGLGHSQTREPPETHRGMTWKAGQTWRAPPTVRRVDVTRCCGDCNPMRIIEPAEAATTL